MDNLEQIESEFPLTKSTSILYRTAQRFMNRELKRFDLNSSEYPFLVILYRASAGLNQEAIAQSRGCDKSAVTKAVRSLSAKGYVTRLENEKNRRENIISLTEKAAAVMPEILDAQERCEELITEGLDKNIAGLTRTTMSSIAHKMLKTLNTHDTDKEEESDG